MRILGLDPGNEQSAFVVWDTDTETIVEKMLWSNVGIRNHFITYDNALDIDCVVIEMIESFGMAVGRTVFETVFWIGRFYEVCERVFATASMHRVGRKEVKLHLCNSPRAKDTNVRMALMDRYGVPGVKANPGKLYGVKKDQWSALSLCVYWQDKIKE